MLLLVCLCHHPARSALDEVVAVLLDQVPPGRTFNVDVESIEPAVGEIAALHQRGALSDDAVVGAADRLVEAGAVGELMGIVGGLMHLGALRFREKADSEEGESELCGAAEVTPSPTEPRGRRRVRHCPRPSRRATCASDGLRPRP